MLHVARAQTWIHACQVGVGMELAALIAGVALATFPYSAELPSCTSIANAAPCFLLKSWCSKSRSSVACFLVSIAVYAKGKLSESVYKRTCHNETLQDRSVSTWVVLLSKKHKRICVLSPRSLGSMERSNTFETSSSHSSSRHWVCRLENTHASKILSGWDVFSWVHGNNRHCKTCFLLYTQFHAVVSLCTLHTYILISVDHFVHLASEDSFFLPLSSWYLSIFDGTCRVSMLKHVWQNVLVIWSTMKH